MGERRPEIACACPRTPAHGERRFVPWDDCRIIPSPLMGERLEVLSHCRRTRSWGKDMLFAEAIRTIPAHGGRTEIDATPPSRPPFTNHPRSWGKDGGISSPSEPSPLMGERRSYCWSWADATANHPRSWGKNPARSCSQRAWSEPSPLMGERLRRSRWPTDRSANHPRSWGKDVMPQPNVFARIEPSPLMGEGRNALFSLCSNTNRTEPNHPRSWGKDKRKGKLVGTEPSPLMGEGRLYDICCANHPRSWGKDELADEPNRTEPSPLMGGGRSVSVATNHPRSWGKDARLAPPAWRRQPNHPRSWGKDGRTRCHQ
jgi:hypothetical protein